MGVDGLHRRTEQIIYEMDERGLKRGFEAITCFESLAFSHDEGSWHKAEGESYYTKINHQPRFSRLATSSSMLSYLNCAV